MKMTIFKNVKNVLQGDNPTKIDQFIKRTNPDLILNAVSGSLGINIPVNIITGLIVGVLGLPGVIILLLLNLRGII